MRIAVIMSARQTGLDSFGVQHVWLLFRPCVTTGCFELSTGGFWFLLSIHHPSRLDLYDYSAQTCSNSSVWSLVPRCHVTRCQVSRCQRPRAVDAWAICTRDMRHVLEVYDVQWLLTSSLTFWTVGCIQWHRVCVSISLLPFVCYLYIVAEKCPAQRRGNGRCIMSTSIQGNVVSHQPTSLLGRNRQFVWKSTALHNLPATIDYVAWSRTDTL